MKVLIFGATGMVGCEVLTRCLADPRVGSVLSIGRRPTGRRHAKLTEIEHQDFLDLSALHNELARVDLCIYCLGVYQGQVPKALFWEITVDYLCALVKALERTGKDPRFCLFSGMGASPRENIPIRYARAKGRAERILTASALTRTFIFRPGFIMPGPTRKPFSLWVRLTAPIYRLFPFIGIDAPDLARAMVEVGIEGHDKTLFENWNLRTLRRRG